MCVYSAITKNNNTTGFILNILDVKITSEEKSPGKKVM